MQRITCLVAAISVSMAVVASPAAGSVTIGQIDPAASPSIGCDTAANDLAQPTVTSGNTYVVPQIPPATALVITSWSHNASSVAGQTLTMKIFRKVADPATYTVVGHDGPRPLTRGLNRFPASIAVKPGDVLGLNTVSAAPTACVFVPPGETFLFSPGNLADGASAAFPLAEPGRLNVSAVVAPSNGVTVGKATLNRKKGTATLAVNVPNPGELTASGTGVSAASAGQAVTSKAVGVGPAQLLIKAKGKKKRKLNDTGKVKLNVTVTYTPQNGDPASQAVKVKLKKS